MYLDITVTNTSSVFLSLHNAVEPSTTISVVTTATAVPSDPPNIQHLSFKLAEANRKPATPISLVARVDDQEYILLPNSSGLVTICAEAFHPKSNILSGLKPQSSVLMLGKFSRWKGFG